MFIKNFLPVALGATTLVVFAAFQSACSRSDTGGNSGGNGSDSTSYSSESVMSEVNNQSQASESSSSVGLMGEIPSDAAADLGSADSQLPVHPLASACNFSARGACAASADTIAWGGCTVDYGYGVMTGGWAESFSGTNASTCTVPIVNGETVLRTSSGSTITGPLGGNIATDTNGGTAWDNTVIPSTGSSIVNNSGTRTITVNGTHKVGKGPLGKTLFDHFIVTTTPLTVTGTRLAATRAITGGVLKVYHNLARYSASFTFSGVTWGSAICCYPTSGSITGTLTGSLTGTTLLTFSSTCGSATYQDTGASSGTPITLSQCM